VDKESTQLVVDGLKAAGVELVVTLPEEPTSSVIKATREDPYFTTVTVTAEGHGLALCAGASLGGRDCVFFTGVAGLLVGTWALAQVGMVYGAPFTIIASYRGDFGDRTGIPGSQLRMFREVLEPQLNMLRIPYEIVKDPSILKKSIVGAKVCCREYGTPIALLLTGDFLA
jgi:sulfopyruvate decarboxylase TPP-binding subunit